MGKLEIFTIEMPQLKRSRTIRVLLPNCYDPLSQQKYPVIYMQDAQNLFDVSTAAYKEIWDLPHTMDQLELEQGYQGAIVVGIDHGGTERYNEYSPWVSRTIGKLKNLLPISQTMGGDGEAYGRFIVETLKPYIDSRYHTQSDRHSTGIAGSSMGAFIALYLGATYPHVFSKVGAFSTAMWFAEDELIELIGQMEHTLQTRWYVDIGTQESSNASNLEFPSIYLQGSNKLIHALEQSGVASHDIHYVIDEGAIHNEKEWARRFPEAFKWLFEIN